MNILHSPLSTLRRILFNPYFLTVRRIFFNPHCLTVRRILIPTFLQLRRIFFHPDFPIAEENILQSTSPQLKIILLNPLFPTAAKDHILKFFKLSHIKIFFNSYFLIAGENIVQSQFSHSRGKFSSIPTFQQLRRIFFNPQFSTTEKKILNLCDSYCSALGNTFHL
jgi:hypothetical protein